MKNVKIAVTGGIGSGKSATIKLLQQLGYPTFSCDEIYCECIELPEYVKEVEKAFPNAVIGGKIDRKALSSLVFSNEENLKILNALAHPLIMERLHQKMKGVSGVCFAEVPLLFEKGYEKDFDKVIVVIRNKTERIAAVQNRDRLSVCEIEERMLRQYDYDKNETHLKENFFVIENNGSMEQLKIQLLKILENAL